MPKQFAMIVTGLVPDDKLDAGHEAVFKTRPAAEAVVAMLVEMGLESVSHTRKLATARHLR